MLALTLAAVATIGDPYEIYARARSRWDAQAYPRYLSYVVTVSGNDPSLRVTNTYASFTDTVSGMIKVRATSAEEAAHPSAPRGVQFQATLRVSYTRHAQLGRPPSVDGGGDIKVSKTMHLSPQQQFDLLGVPMLSPTYSFGLAPERPASRTGESQANPPSNLKTIASVTAVRRDYDIRYDGTQTIDDVACYHLVLTPRRDPATFRLRELWMDEEEFTTRQALVQGNFTAGPGPRLAWLIHFTVRDGLTYITDETALGAITYLGHTYSNVTLAFNTVQAAPAMDPMWALSMFRTSGDVLQEPAP